MASATSQSDRWRREKNHRKLYSKILDSSIFELEWHAAPQTDYQQFRFELKLKVLFIKIFEKIEVYDFRLKKCVNFCQTGSLFWTIVQDMLKTIL